MVALYQYEVLLYTQWIADLNLDHLSRFDSYMRAKVGQLYISLFHAYARKNNMWILDHGEALLKVDPLQPAQVVRVCLIHCLSRPISRSEGRWAGTRPDLSPTVKNEFFEFSCMRAFCL